MLRAPVHHRRRLVAVDIVQSAADQRESLVLQIAHGWRYIQPRRQPGLDRVLIAGRHVRQVIGLHGADVAADNALHRITLTTWLAAHYQNSERHARQRSGQSGAGHAESRPAEPWARRGLREGGQCLALQGRADPRGQTRRSTMIRQVRADRRLHGTQLLELASAGVAARDMAVDAQPCERSQRAVDQPRQQSGGAITFHARSPSRPAAATVFAG